MRRGGFGAALSAISRMNPLLFPTKCTAMAADEAGIQFSQPRLLLPGFFAFAALVLSLASAQSEQVPVASAKPQSSAHTAPGTLIWQDQYDQANRRDNAQAVASDKNVVVVAGASTGADFVRNILVRAHEVRTGAILWQRTIDAGGFGDARAVKIGANVAVVSGIVTSTKGDGDWMVAGLDLKTGEILWRDTQDYEAGYDEATQVEIKDHRVFASGAAACPVDTFYPCDMITRAYDLHSGRLLWQDRFDPNGGDDYASGLTADGDLLFVVGASGSANDAESAFVVRALDVQTGATQWQDLVQDPGAYNWAIKNAVQGDRLFAVGFRQDDWVVRSYNTRNGQLLWEQTYRLEMGDAAPFDGAWFVATDEKHVVAAGYGSHAGPNFFSRAWVVNTYDLKTGTLLWSDVYDTSAADEAVGGLAINKGQVFAYGLASPQGQRMFLRAYGIEDGRVLWEDASDAPGSPWGVQVIGLAEDQGLVTIVGSIRGVNSSYWYVGTYDSGVR